MPVTTSSPSVAPARPHPARAGGLWIVLFAVYLVLLVWIVLFKLELPHVGLGELRVIRGER